MRKPPVITVEDDGDVTVVITTKDLRDDDVIAAFGDAIVALIADNHRKIVIDITQTTSFVSATVGKLISVAKELRRVSGRLAIVCNDEGVLDMFRVMRLIDLLTVRTTRTEAIDAVSS